MKYLSLKIRIGNLRLENGFPRSFHFRNIEFLIFPPRRHVVEHEFFVVETFSRGKRIRNERKLEKELFRSRFEPVESTSGSKNCSKFSLEVRMRLIRFTSCNYSKRIIGKIERWSKRNRRQRRMRKKQSLFVI